jgi:type I restriction enzyme S subunit
MNNQSPQILANNTFTTPNYYQKMNQLENTILFLRDYLRDQFSITGKNCYDHCCIFFFIRFLNEERVKLLDIDSKYIFDTFLNTLEETYIQSPFDTMEVFKELLRENNVQEILDVYQFKFDIPYVKLIEILKKLKTLINPDDFNDEIDLIGKIYEMHLKTGAMGGRDVGQYFTNRRFVNYMASKMTYNTNGSGRMCDPAMGSSGFLTQFKIFNPYFNHQLVYGIEKEKSAYLGAQLNYWLTTGVKNYKFYNVDSLISREVETNFYQYILANPPFGVKGLRYNEMSADIRQLNIKSTKSDCLFVQKIYCMLEEDGEALIILPNGFFNTNSRDYLLTRKLILERCVVKAIYNLPKKINYNGNLVDAFENTGVNVRVLHFVKTFVEEDYKVPFINLNENMEEHLIEETERSELIKRDCKLVEVIKTKDIRELYKGCRIVKLGDVCEFKNGSMLSVKDIVDGPYPVIGGGKSPTGYHNKYNMEENAILVSKSGTAGHISRYSTKVWMSDCFCIKSSNSILDNDYLYYYLKAQQEYFYSLKSGTGTPHVNIRDIIDYEIPIPSMETQKMLVDYYNISYENNKMNKQMMKNLDEECKAFVRAHSVVGKVYIYKLGQVCEFKNGRQLDKKEFIDGEYNVFGGGKKPLGLHNSYNRDGNETIISGTGENCGTIIFNDFKKFYASQCFTINSINKILLDKYLYLYLKYNYEEIIKNSRNSGTGQPYIRISNILELNIDIVIPLPVRQQKIIQRCDDYYEMIKKLEIKIQHNEEDCREILHMALESENLPQDLLNLPINPINEIQPIQSTPTIDTGSGSSSRSHVSSTNRANHTSRSRTRNVQQQSDNQTINEPVPIQSTPSLDSGSSSRSRNSRSKSPQVNLEQLELTKENLKKLTNEQLIQICKNKKIKGYSGKPKDKLIELILQ